MNIDFSIILDFRMALFLGLLETLKLTVICIALGTVLGFLIALARTSKNRVLFVISTAYVVLFRGTPVLIQLFWIFFCLPLVLGIDISNFVSALISLTLFMGAITSETFRASFNFVGRDQYDACIAIGLPYRTQVQYVVLPQALRLVLPTWSNEAIAMLKYTAVVFLIAVPDLMGQAKIMAAKYFAPIAIYMIVAVFYLVLVGIAYLILRQVERRRLVVVVEVWRTCTLA